MKALSKDLIENPELWRLSLMTGDKGISVFACPVVGEGSVISEYLPYDATVSSRASAIEDAVYANPMLLLPFRKVDIVFDAVKTAVVPVDVQPDDFGRMLNLGSECVLREAPLDSREKLIYAVDRGVDNFVSRTYDMGSRHHVLEVLNRYCMRKKQSLAAARMYINIGVDTLDILVYNRLGLCALQHVACTSADECVYRALAVFKQCGLDADYDEIVVSGNSERRHHLMAELSRFIANVLPAIFPSAAYHGDSTAHKAPFPLVILPLCE